MTIDWTISLGNIFTVLTLVAGFAATGLGFMYTIKGELLNMSTRLALVEAHIKTLTDILIQLARQEERLNSHAMRIHSLEDREEKEHK